MTEFAWFKLLLRAIGVLLLGLGAPSLINQIAWIAISLTSVPAPGMPRGYELPYLGALLGAGAQCGLGVYLLFGGNWFVNRCLAEIRGHCLNCGYSLEGVPGNRCPECGSPLRQEPAGSAAPSRDGSSGEPSEAVR